VHFRARLYGSMYARATRNTGNMRTFAHCTLPTTRALAQHLLCPNRPQHCMPDCNTLHMQIWVKFKKFMCRR